MNDFNWRMNAPLDKMEAIQRGEGAAGWMSSLVQRMDKLEAPIVRRIASVSRRLSLFHVSVLVNRMANGWMYLIVGALMIGLKGWQSWRPAAAGLISVGLCQILYRIIKRAIARRRPCEADSALSSPEKPLDKYSFPSGHCMSAVAVAIPLGWAFPAVIPVMIFVVLLIGWARLSLGHHYPSDIIMGCLIGAGISLGVTALFFNLIRF
ncbi:MAG: phosphatase PAP2 family protein [Candidatus Acidiferrales bacterium]